MHQVGANSPLDLLAQFSDLPCSFNEYVRQAIELWRKAGSPAGAIIKAGGHKSNVYIFGHQIDHARKMGISVGSMVRHALTSTSRAEVLKRFEEDQQYYRKMKRAIRRARRQRWEALQAREP
jgi:hypothetical protein